MNETPEFNVQWEGERAPFAKAFIAAQAATEAVKKASTNPAFKSKYADLAGVVEAVVPALNKHGIGVLQFPGFDGETVSLTTTLIHESGASVTSVLRLRPSKSDPQGVGSATTYARRYSLLAITGAAPEDDDGNAASGPVQRAVQAHADVPKPTLAERADRLEETLRAVKTDADRAKAYRLASGLLAELDDKDPDRFAQIERLNAEIEDRLTDRVAA